MPAIQPAAPYTVPTSAKDAYALLAQQHERVLREQAELEARILQARELGASWAGIGQALDLSKQTAFNRYGKLQPANDVEQHHAQAVKFMDGTAPAKAKVTPGKAKNPMGQTVDYASKKRDTPAPAETDEAVDTALIAAAAKFREWDHTAPEHHSTPMDERTKACPYCLHLTHADAKGMTWFYPGCKPTLKDPKPATPP